MEQGFWISVVVLLVWIFASWLIQGHWTRKSSREMEERMGKSSREMEERMARIIEGTVSPLAKVTASTKTEIRNVEKKMGESENG